MAALGPKQHLKRLDPLVQCSLWLNFANKLTLQDSDIVVRLLSLQEVEPLYDALKKSHSTRRARSP